MTLKEIRHVFKNNLGSFNERKEQIKSVSFSKINWSDSYLDFTPYSSAIDQLEQPKVYNEEKTASIQNHFLNNKLVYSFRNENENWGTVFIDYEDDNTIKWYLYLENYDHDIVLHQVKIAYYNNDRVEKVLSYLMDEDEETFMLDCYNYSEKGKLETITRNGFYEMESNILPERKFYFEYNEHKKVKIHSQQNIANEIRRNLIYDGEILK
ncbi:hypothetical protein [uncultured Aquimarina sp.]|uniref:hypothetical protein n=1 Tax=uncultured Aquimarina sp. TaxID=575652 RepID=UPI002638234D|nr:hypothetical protein [uncultured Aquimarina sp.]